MLPLAILASIPGQTVQRDAVSYDTDTLPHVKLKLAVSRSAKQVNAVELQECSLPNASSAIESCRPTSSLALSATTEAMSTSEKASCWDRALDLLHALQARRGSDARGIPTQSRDSVDLRLRLLTHRQIRCLAAMCRCDGRHQVLVALACILRACSLDRWRIGFSSSMSACDRGSGFETHILLVLK